jgi:UDP-GlcNAc:undecaprenyl-phosphate GlcNAc-1-phosphate transferase
MNWLLIYFAVFLCSLFFTIIFTPIFKQIAVSIGVVDIPSKQEHKNHSRTIPLMGGFAMCSAWLMTILIGFLAPLIFKTDIPNYISGIFIMQKRIVVIALGALFMTLLGFFDDKKAMSAKIKFMGQFIIAIFVVTSADIKITLFINSGIINWCVTVFWILFVINAVNFFDNMDGLATGIASIAFFFFMTIAIIFKHYFVASLSAAGLGAAVGFWIFNHSPAKIFMGDCGSHFLGYTLAITGALTTYYQQGITQTPLAVLIPLFILAIPLFDLLSVVVIRIKIRKPIYIGDNNHISHRFNKMGMTKKTAVLCVHLLAIIVSLSVLPMLWGDVLTAMICFIQACVVLLLISILQYLTKKNSKIKT